MQGRIVSGWWSRGSSRSRKHEQLRLVVTKASNRSAVHGARLPITDQLHKKEVEKEINEGKEEKENKRKEVEKAVDSQLNKSDNTCSLLK